MEPFAFTDDDPDEGCASCPLADLPRRDFLRHTGTALGALIMVGMPPELAATIRPTAIRAIRRVAGMPSYPIPTQDGVQVDKRNQVILVRWKQDVFAFNLSCPHQNTALHWNEGDAEFQCPKHHSKYRPDGTFISGRATRNMDRFSVTRSGDTVLVDVDQMHKSDADGTGWSAAVVHL